VTKRLHVRDGIAVDLGEPWMVVKGGEWQRVATTVWTDSKLSWCRYGFLPPDAYA